MSSLIYVNHSDWRKAKSETTIPNTNLWIFGYGSLMWDPGFSFVESQCARIFGYHRQLCLWSIEYRGTRENPGLILGLDHGGSCQGIGYKVRDSDIDTVTDYLFEREMITDLYRPILLPLRFDSGKTVTALTFVSKPDHPQYAGRLNFKEVVRIVRGARGPRGSNIQYVTSTVKHLTELGISNTELHRIAQAL